MHCEEIKLKSGKKRWVCVADAPPDPVTGKRRQITRRGKTKKEAEKRVEKVIDSLEEHGVDQRVSQTMTFDKVASNWLETYALTGVKRGTVRVREKEIKILNKHMAKTSISGISHAMYQKIINKLSKDYARTTVKGVHGTAGMIFRYAIRNKLIKDDPTVDVIIPKKRRTVEEIESDPTDQKYLDNEELNELLEAALLHGLDLDIERFYLLAFSGMRPGELCALKWSDVDFKKNTVRITKTLYNENNNMIEYELIPPKTEGSIRMIELEEEVIQLLKSHRKRQLKIHASYQKEFSDYHNGNFVFCRANGYPYIPKNIITRMARLLEYTSIQKRATPHIFRHSHISMMTEAGIDLATIMERVGHDDPQTTLKIYTHVTKKMKKDASDKISNLYGNTLKKIDLKLSQ